MRVNILIYCTVSIYCIIHIAVNIALYLCIIFCKCDLNVYCEFILSVVRGSPTFNFIFNSEPFFEY